MRLEIKDLRVAYGKIEAVKGISLVVNQGEIVSSLEPTALEKLHSLRPFQGY